jgi:hypothetical protein
MGLSVHIIGFNTIAGLVRLTFVDSAASGFTLAAGLRGRAVGATERASEGAKCNRPDAAQVLFG